MLKNIIAKVMANQSVIDKINIARTHSNVGNEVAYLDPFHNTTAQTIAIGDDCAAIPDGYGGYLLFAAEGIISAFTEGSPWFAGYSAVMVNISDVCAMGGLPLAVTDVLWLKDELDGKEIWAGMKTASEAYGVPIVGGHTCYRSKGKHLAVSVLGKANRLLTSYDATVGESLVIAIDLNGNYFENYPFWNASTTADPAHLKEIIRIPFELAERELSKAAKDISMGGIIGTLAMLMHTSGVGVSVNLDDIPKPAGVDWEKWLISFPSFGYLFTCEPENLTVIKALFARSNIACEAIGSIITAKHIAIKYKNEKIDIELN